MRTGILLMLSGSVVVPLMGCATTRDIAHYPFPEAQAELREVLDGIIHDSETANVVGLRDIHLKSEKFTKFGGGEIYERMDYEQCVDKGGLHCISPFERAVLNI